MKRQFYLDNLKLALIILVIFHHAGQAYGDGGAWPYSPSNPLEVMPWIWHFFSVNAAFSMGLYFLISGYFVPLSYDTHGARDFIRKKLMRLGIPLLVMGGMISYFSGKLEIAHMWFVESLLLFCLIYALVRRFCKPISDDCSSRPTIIGLTIVSAVMGVGSYFIRQVSPQDHWIWPFGVIPLPMEPAHYLQYVIMFVLGLLARRFNWFEKMSNVVGAVSLTIGCVLAVGIYLRSDGWWDSFVWQWFGVYESFLCVFICFGLIWFFRQCLDRSTHRVRWWVNLSYGAYVVHLLLMVVLQNIFDGTWMGVFGKFVFIALVTSLLSFLLTWLLRLIPGVRNVI